MAPDTREAAVERLFLVVAKALMTSDIPAPDDSEGEVEYVRRALKPFVVGLLRDAAVRELTVLGGTPAPTPVLVLGYQFFPDITINRYAEMLIAIEVKFIDSSTSVASAIGQATIYHAAGYRRSIAFLIDRRTEDFYFREKVFAENRSTLLIVRRKAAPGSLLAHQGLAK